MLGSAPLPSAGSQPESQPSQATAFSTQGPSSSLFGSSGHPVVSTPSGLFGQPMSSTASNLFRGSSQPASSTSRFGGVPAQTSSACFGQTTGFEGAGTGQPLYYQPTAPTTVGFNFPQTQAGFSFAVPSAVDIRTVPYPTDPKPTRSQILTGFELEGLSADFKLSVGGRQFKVCSVLVFQRSKRLQREFEGKKSEHLTHEVDLPLTIDPEPFVRWLHDIDGSALVESIKTFDHQVDLLALAVYFDIQPELHLEARVLSVTVPLPATLGNTGLRQGLPPCWDRAYLPLPLVLQLLQAFRKTNSTGVFGYSSPSQPAQCALEWLGERRCFSAEEIEELRQSVEFKKMKSVLQENYIMPPTLNDFLVLAKRYPVAIEIFSVGDVFKSLGLI